MASDRFGAKAGGLKVPNGAPGREKPVAQGAGGETSIRSQKSARPTGGSMVAPPPIPRNAKAAPAMRCEKARPAIRAGRGAEVRGSSARLDATLRRALG